MERETSLCICTFFEKSDGHLKIAPSLNKGRGVWIEEQKEDEKYVIGSTWQDMLFDNNRFPEEFYFAYDVKSLRIFENTEPFSTFKRIKPSDKWVVKLTGKVKGNLVEVKATRKKFEHCYDSSNSVEDVDPPQKDLETIKGYVKIVRDSGLPNIWFLVCEA